MTDEACPALPAEKMGFTPIAVLMCKGEFARVMTIKEPPPPELFLPRPVRYEVKQSAEPPAMLTNNHRVFRLSRMRSSKHRWLRVYNEGRSCTPEDAYVYIET